MQNVIVNDAIIPIAAIAAEAQNHPAPSPDLAWSAAAQALAVRELLLQEARRLDLRAGAETDAQGRRESDEDALIRILLERELKLPKADEAACRRYYENNRTRFRSLDLYEAAHILFAASRDDEEAYFGAVARAEIVLDLLKENPQVFDAIAREQSACPSGKSGGQLGQIARGDTVPEFETFLCNLEEGQLCPVPVRTRFGVHVLRLDHRIEGRQLPFEAIEAQIATYLEDTSFRRAVAQYIAILAGRARIEGVDFAGASSPLVQ